MSDSTTPLAVSRKDAQTQGLLTYFTAKPCKRGHLSERRTSNKTCQQCHSEARKRRFDELSLEEREKSRAKKRADYRAKVGPKKESVWTPERHRNYNKTYYAENTAIIKARAKAYYWANLSHVKTLNRAWRLENKEHLTAYSKAYRETHVLEIRESKRLRRLEDIEKHRMTRRQRYLKNPGHFKIEARKRKARLKGATGSFSQLDLNAKLELQAWLCYYCSSDLSESGYHIDHKIPVSQRGSNWPANICAACPACNLRKHAKGFWDFLEEISHA